MPTEKVDHQSEPGTDYNVPDSSKKKKKKDKVKEEKKKKALERESLRNQWKKGASKKKNVWRDAAEENLDYVDSPTIPGEKKLLSNQLAKEYNPVVMEKKIMHDSNKTRHDIGREDFVKEVWNWKNEYGETILNQLWWLGVSLDRSRECFTMDEQRLKAVIKAFVRIYKDGLIYRGHWLVIWDSLLQTTISGIEVDYIDIEGRTPLEVPGYTTPVEFGVLTLLAYPLKGGLGEIEVVTTRMKTMFGDTCIVVHPEDERYTNLHGKYAIHPFNGRRFPTVCDGILADQTFGTGAVKITPDHDLDDLWVAREEILQEVCLVETKVTSTRRGDRIMFRVWHTGQLPSKARRFSGEQGKVEFQHFQFGACTGVQAS
ncbi:hypothetical protein MKW94_018266 [Papaver nudicaule]|uniref:valine--tRNA ligase n=1 Tax=Papaver nudicaule TaxID=74823 RepID=A0AA41VL93_PAPNU|nr:hypothetical protein [Papaver nudicaule]